MSPSEAAAALIAGSPLTHAQIAAVAALLSLPASKGTEGAS